MEDLKKYLAEYGLTVQLDSRKNDLMMIKLVDYLLHWEEPDAYNRLNRVTKRGFVIQIVDVDKVFDKFNISDQNKAFKNAIQKMMCVRLPYLKKGTGAILGMRDKEEANSQIEEIIENTPEDFGDKGKEIKLKKLFGSGEKYREGVENLYKLLEDLNASQETKKSLKEFTEEIKRLTLEKKDEIDWYMDIGKQHQRFVKTLKTFNIKNEK